MRMAIDWEDHGHFDGHTVAGMGGVQGALPDWENPSVFAINKEPPHAPLLPRDELRASSFYHSLNGRWRFLLAGIPSETPARFWQPEFDDGRWGEVQVPGHWELQGHGQPMYTNIQYPFPADPPHVPHDDNPTGCYRRTFEVPAGWAGREVVLVFEGVDSAFHLWINGQFAGFSKGSRNPAEFRVTPFLQPGANTVAVRVYRWSDASYIEDQDMWYLSGLFREVYLHALPPVHIRDAGIRTLPDLERGSARVEVDVDVCGAAGSREPLKVSGVLTDEAGACVAQAAAAVAAGTGRAALALDVARARLWSAETPYLYTLTLTLAGAVAHTTRHRVGIREVHVANGQFWINGRSIKLRGVNRHEWDGDRGRALTDDDMRRDARRIKQANFNAVRCSHYPNQSLWYELCDAYGLYVIDEADLESHGMQDRLTVDERWREAYVDRVRRLVYRDRNHACVVAWSMGNEAGYGSNIDAMAAETRRIDPGRPINYYHAQTAPVVDWIGQHYVRIDQMEELARNDPSGRPILQEEYAHAMGNALGNLQEYWDAIERTPRLIGGFIWQWCDLAIRRRLPDGRLGYTRGGDFGDRPHDGWWAVCGMTLPDGTLRPTVDECRKVFQPVVVREVDGALAITSKRDFTGLDDLEAFWTMAEDGREIAAGRLGVPALGPGQTARVPMPAVPEGAGTGERILTVRWVTRQEAAWAPRGHEIAWDQVVLKAGAPVVLPQARPQVVVEAEGDCYTLRTAALRLRWHRWNGQWISLRFGRREVLWTGPELCAWRAPLDSDQPFLNGWMAAHLHELQRKSTECALVDGVGVRTATLWRTPGGEEVFRETLTTRLLGDDLVRLEHHVVPLRPLPPLPRLGLRLRLMPGVSDARWYGRGPHECLADRCRGARVAIHAASIDGLAVPYLHSQENGMRCDVRWLELVSRDGLALTATGDAPFGFTARRHTLEDLAHAEHPEDLVERPFVEVCLDHRHSGTGNTTLRAERLARYQVPAEETAWALTLRVSGERGRA